MSTDPRQVEGFNVRGDGDRLQLWCPECARLFPIFPVSARWLDRAAMVHRRDEHGEDGMRVPAPAPLPTKPRQAAAPEPTTESERVEAAR